MRNCRVFPVRAVTRTCRPTLYDQISGARIQEGRSRSLKLAWLSRRSSLPFEQRKISSHTVHGLVEPTVNTIFNDNRKRFKFEIPQKMGNRLTDGKEAKTLNTVRETCPAAQSSRSDTRCCRYPTLTDESPIELFEKLVTKDLFLTI